MYDHISCASVILIPNVSDGYQFKEIAMNVYEKEHMWVQSMISEYLQGYRSGKKSDK